MNRKIEDYDELEVYNRHWFESCSNWGTTLHGDIVDGRMFITSEPNFTKTKRKFTVRAISEKNTIYTASEYQEFDTLIEAENFIKNYL